MVRGGLFLRPRVILGSIAATCHTWCGAFGMLQLRCTTHTQDRKDTAQAKQQSEPPPRCAHRRALRTVYDTVLTHINFVSKIDPSQMQRESRDGGWREGRGRGQKKELRCVKYIYQLHMRTPNTVSCKCVLIKNNNKIKNRYGIFAMFSKF